MTACVSPRGTNSLAGCVGEGGGVIQKRYLTAGVLGHDELVSDCGHVAYDSDCVHAQECRQSWLAQDCEEMACDWQSCRWGITELGFLLSCAANCLTLALAL